MIKELEGRIQQLTVEMEDVHTMRQQLQQCNNNAMHSNAELQRINAELKTNADQLQSRLSQAEARYGPSFPVCYSSFLLVFFIYLFHILKQQIWCTTVRVRIKGALNQ